MKILESKVRLHPQQLAVFCGEALTRVGVPAEEAKLAADVLTKADLRGVYSHGSTLLPLYVRRITAGQILPAADVTVLRDHLATALVDGKNGLGQVTAARAMRLALEKAERLGSAWVGVRGSNHFGMAAYYAMMALPRDMIGIVLTVSNISTMAPWGGLEVLIGNNPIAVAVPASEEFPVVFDAACSVAARRKIHDALANSEQLPEGWALDRRGYPTTDPQEALDGLLLPIGGYKGYGLAFVISLLAGVLAGAHVGRLVNNANVGHLVGALNVSAFSDPRAFGRAVDQAIREVRNSQKAPSVDRIFVPGEQGFLAEEEQLAHGIALSPTTWDELNKLASRLGIPAPAPL